MHLLKMLSWRLTVLSGPDKVTLVQPSGCQPEAKTVVYQHFHAVGACVGKQISRVGVGSTEDFDHAAQGGVDARAHVQGLGGQPYGIDADHASTSRSHWSHWLAAAMGQ